MFVMRLFPSSFNTPALKFNQLIVYCKPDLLCGNITVKNVQINWPVAARIWTLCGHHLVLMIIYLSILLTGWPITVPA